MNMVEDYGMPTGGESIIVHCSNGSTRTGTYIALDTQRQRLRDHGDVNVFVNIMHLNQQRMGMVSSIEQLKFIYEALCRSVGLAC